MAWANGTTFGSHTIGGVAPVADDDWRLSGQERYLSRRVLSWRFWWSDRPDWDHDHCAFCWAKFGRAELESDVLQQGFVTSDDSYHWICSACFDDFEARFGWTVDPAFMRL